MLNINNDIYLKNYFLSKGKSRFLTPKGKIISNQLIYAVFNTKKSLKIKTLQGIKKLFLDYFNQQKLLGIIPDNFNFVVFFNLNVKAVKKIGRKFHIDFLCDTKNLPLSFFYNWPYGDKNPVTIRYLKNNRDLVIVLNYMSKQIEEYKKLRPFSKNKIDLPHVFRFSEIN